MFLYAAMSAFPATLHPGNFNQAMMDLGSGRPVHRDSRRVTAARCGDYCLAGARDQAELFPVKSAKKARRVEQKTVLVVIEEDRLFSAQKSRNRLTGRTVGIPVTGRGSG